MADKILQGRNRAAIPFIAGVGVLVTMSSGLLSGVAVGTSGWPGSSFAGQVAASGIVVLALAGAIAIWVATAFRRLKQQQQRLNAFVGSALNQLGQGVAIIDAQGRMIYCNDRCLEMYGVNRAGLPRIHTGGELPELVRAAGGWSRPDDEFYRCAGSAEGHVFELANGRHILIKYMPLPNGGSITTHADCSEQSRLSSELVTTKQFLESVIDNVPVCIAAKNIADGRYILANRAFEQFSRFSREQIVGKRADEIFTVATAAAIDRADQAALQDGGHRSEMVVERGAYQRTLAANRVIARDDRDQPIFLIALFEDVTDRNALSAELEKTKKFLETVVDNIPVSLIVQDAANGRYLLANRSAENMLNCRREEAVGMTVANLFQPKEASIIRARDAVALQKRGIHTEEHPISTRDGLKLFLTRRAIVLDDSGSPQYLIKTHEDVTARRQTEARMAHMAYHDGLTDLPNRAAFMKALSQMIEACRGTDEQFAVLSIDFNGLKEVNDVFGQAVGDKLLVEVARRLEKVASGGLVARLGGDEFGLIIDGVQPVAGETVARAVADALDEEIILDGKSVRASVTTGISIFPRDGADAAAMLGNAGAALFRAKARSRGSIGLFEPEMDSQLRDRRVLHQDLSAAIHKGELSLHYQPQARTGQKITDADITGFEALARWIHPTRGFVPPGEFIPLAEESGLIVELGEWILRQACLEAASWPVPLQIAVNLSPAQFMHGDLVSLVQSILIETGLPPGQLELEITEGVLIEDFERGLALLRRLKALGVRISMDDFGSGYSSLTYLQAFPFDKIKIDRTFVINLGLNVQSPAIVRAVIGLGHGLDISIVAEGVETEEQLSFLANEGCDGVQGYFIGRPAPIEQYARLVGRSPQLQAVRKAG